MDTNLEERQATYAERLAKLYSDIADGNGPLDRIERFCRENKICDFSTFIDESADKAPDLYQFATKNTRGTGARIRGIEARIAKVRRELRDDESVPGRLSDSEIREQIREYVAGCREKGTTPVKSYLYNHGRICGYNRMKRIWGEMLNEGEI